MGHLKLIGY